MSVVSILNTNGICRVPDAYSIREVDELNRAVDSIFLERAAERRSYVHVNELHELGLLEKIFCPQMRNVLFSIMPDPVLYHCFVIETAGNDLQPNIFGDTLAGWHRDVDCSFSPSEPTHVSIFVYLTDVADDDGAFEFVPQSPERRLRTSTPCILVKGTAGLTFAWQRSYFHRASPNRGPRRRRLVKISIQRNAFPSVHLGKPQFRQVIDELPSGDVAMDILFGRYQGRLAPRLPSSPASSASIIRPTGALGIADSQLTRAYFRQVASRAKSAIRKRLGHGNIAEQVAYD